MAPEVHGDAYQGLANGTGGQQPGSDGQGEILPRLLQSIGNPVQAEKGGAVSEDTPYQGGAKQSQQKFGQGLSVSLPDLVVGVGHTILLQDKDVFHFDIADLCQLEGQGYRRGVVPPLDQTDGLAGNPRQPPQLLLVDVQGGAVFLQTIFQRHLLIPSPPAHFHPGLAFPRTER